MESKRLIRVFPKRTNMTPTDDYAFVGEPQLFLPDWRDIGEVHISVTFTWDIAEGIRLLRAWSQYHPDVYIGGPALNDSCNGFLMGRYVKPGITFTSRGCNHNCPWCLVPLREGKLREMDFWSGNVIQDNNLLQCSGGHLGRVFAMLSGQHGIQFTGGLEADLVTDKIVDRLRDLRISQLFLSADTDGALNPLQKAVEKLHIFGRDRLRCYVLVAYNGETMEKAHDRLEKVWEIGCIPFAQLYQPPELEKIKYSHKWLDLARTWSRPAAIKAIHRTH